MTAVGPDPLDRLRAICLALPQATEREAWGDPTFRVRGKIFAMPKAGDGRFSVWFKAPPGSQAILIGADPNLFFAPPYVGPKGWVGMRLDRIPDWAEVRAFVIRSYGLIAPKRLAAHVSDDEARSADDTGLAGSPSRTDPEWAANAFDDKGRDSPPPAPPPKHGRGAARSRMTER